MKRAWIVLLVTLLIVIPARLYVMATLVDQKTGFYTDGGKMAGIASVVLAVGIIAAIILGYRKTAGNAAVPIRSVGTGVLAALTGVFVAGQSLASFKVSGDDIIMNNIFCAAGFFAAVSFLAAAYDFAAGETMLRRRPVLALFSSIWGCLCLISLFVNYAAVVNRLENVYHTFTVVFLLLFLFSQAKLLSGIDAEKGGKWIYSYGFSAVMVTLADAVPNIVHYFLRKSTLEGGPVGLHLVNIVLAIYILVYLFTLQRVKTEASIVSVAPCVDGHEGDGAEAVSAPKSESEHSEILPEEKEKNAENFGFSTESVQNCLEFLKNSYQSEEKFVENVENTIAEPKIVKS